MSVAGAGKTATVLVVGGRAGAREAAIAAALAGASADGAAILEGLPDGMSTLAGEGPDAPRVLRIAPGCLCCAGNLVLRVTLNRLLRRPPAQLFISLADASHAGRLRLWLAGPPYDALLALGADINLDLAAQG
ncbi:GTP-binding protein [Janthinobacterium fluminis]|uniref:GTP-binding protein n=1 Tax=Janthinobacterium fluminis TaxID=2987524 RepID=A0ABT5K760_9BURK|nr:GTP-binding protein [Janthinobacterium fluminis]MDC8760626.1 GTP-binding protein [Janthinobacterium fluminis]